MKIEQQAAAIRAKFAEYLAVTNDSTDTIIKVVALHFGVPLSTVIDAVTKGKLTRKGARK